MNKISHKPLNVIANSAAKKILAATIATFFIGFATASVVDFQGVNDKEQLVEILENGDPVQIQELFNGGLQVNQDFEGDGTPLIIAVQNHNRPLVEQLLTMGADVNLESATDGNPLIAASANNNLELVDYLLEQGATIDAITQYDETALITASRAGHFNIVKHLVENGADVNLVVEANVLRGKELRTPLNGAKTQQIRDYLLSKGATI